MEFEKEKGSVIEIKMSSQAGILVRVGPRFLKLFWTWSGLVLGSLFTRSKSYDPYGMSDMEWS